MKAKTCLLVGDGTVSTGFARVNHAYMGGLIRAGWDAKMLALHYEGDPHKYTYDIYPARSVLKGAFDPWGVTRTMQLVNELRPDIVCITQDPWNFPKYVDKIGNTPIVASIAVDGMNCMGGALNGLAHAVFWTEFGREQAALGGFRGSASVIPLGVDLDAFTPGERDEARQRLGLPEYIRDSFIVGNVNRNQPRKRLDLTIMYFAEWIKCCDVRDAFLYLHLAPTGDQGIDVGQLMKYYGIVNRLIHSEPEIGPGSRLPTLVDTYRSFDVQVTTTQGEGWGLTAMEGMACGVPQIAPAWAALGEWAAPAAHLVECSSVICTPNKVNVIGGVADREAFIATLDHLYRSPAVRTSTAKNGLELVAQPQYRWEAIGDAFAATLEEVLCRKTVSV